MVTLREQVRKHRFSADVWTTMRDDDNPRGEEGITVTDLPALLGHIEQQWRSSGVPVDERFGPGLPADAVVNALSTAGLPAPDEIVEWFGWHDGAGPHRTAWSHLGPSGWNALSLAEALAERASRLEMAEDLAPDMGVEASHYWEPSWLPLADDGGQGSLAAELSKDGPDILVRAVYWDDPYAFRDVHARSLAEVIRLWSSIIDTGNWSWSHEFGLWQGDRTTLPNDIHVLSLMT